MGKTRRAKIIRSVLFLTVLLVGLGAGIALVKREQDLRSRAETASVNLFLSPDVYAASFLEEFSLDIYIDADADKVSAVELEITYDANLLEGVSIEGTDFLPVVLDAGEIGGGEASITLGSEPSAPKDGIGVIVTLTFKAKEEAGETQIRIDQETEVAAILNTGNVAGVLSPATVTIGTSTTITDTPTSPTATPPPGVTGDINGDRVVNILDFQILSNNFGTNDPDSDLNGDDIVNILDFQILSNNFGKTGN